MDTSEQYIKMCDCPEIQGQKPKGNEFTISYKNPDIWIEHEGSFLYAKHDIWLPRQDQIQEMLIKKIFFDFMAHWDRCIDIPVQFVAKNQDWELSSMEQIWLSCYMLTIHQKFWNGKKWVVQKIKENLNL